MNVNFQFLDHDISHTAFPEKRCCVNSNRPGATTFIASKTMTIFRYLKVEQILKDCDVFLSVYVTTFFENPVDVLYIENAIIFVVVVVTNCY